MLLSEAILLGSVGSGQAFGKFWNRGNTCTYGAALLAVGKLNKDEFWCNCDAVDQTWPYINRYKVQDPTSNKVSMLGDIVLVLNDVYRWTRPQIAAWVAEKEKELGIVDTEAKEEVKEGEYAPL